MKLASRPYHLRQSILALFVLPFVLAATPELRAAEPQAPLFDGMGDHVHPITTDVPLAQRYFDQGLTLAFGFNHPEAERSFREAARLDPTRPVPWPGGVSRWC